MFYLLTYKHAWKMGINEIVWNVQVVYMYIKCILFYMCTCTCSCSLKLFYFDFFAISFCQFLRLKTIKPLTLRL
jgi:hypothetical protein